MDEDLPTSEAHYPQQWTDKVFIVDDDASTRNSLELTLALGGYRVVKFASAKPFLEHISPVHTGCALIDIQMPGMDGLELQRELTRQNEMMSAVFMTSHADVGLAVSAMKAGALDILEKPFANSKLLEVVGAAMTVARGKTERASELRVTLKRYAHLSYRERDVLSLVAAGNSSKKIAIILNISPRTVDVHRAHIMEKLQAESMAELIRLEAVASNATIS